MSYRPISKKPSKRTRALAGKVGINVGLPATLHRKVRLACLSRDKNLEEALTEALGMWLADHPRSP